MLTRTKIVCTIGPSVNSYKKIIELIDAGMDVARINFSHGSCDDHLKVIEMIQKARKEKNKPIGILLDTKGPEIRIGLVKNDKIEVNNGDILILTENYTDKENEISINPFSALKNVEIDDKILFDDGYVITKVIDKKNHQIVIQIENSGILKSRKGVNIPKVPIDLPAMTEHDVKDITFGVKNGIDLIAASFIRSAHHVLSIKKLLANLNHPEIMVFSKIENHEGVENFDTIVEVSDGIMVARGDLGVEVDLSLVPKYQKMMIRKCYQSCKPVITATQMLESMIQNPRPTRAEASDVANAIYDSTSAVMLSGETAAGKYPIQTVKQMKKIVKQAEIDFDYKSFFYHAKEETYFGISCSVAIAAVKTAYSANAKAIFVYSSSGFTARLISRLRPDRPIFALTSNIKTYYQLSIVWGVTPIYHPDVKGSKEAFKIMAKFTQDKNFVNFGDIVVVTAGVPFGRKGSTNMIIVENIGHILVRAFKGEGSKVEGKISIIVSTDDFSKKDIKDKIIVISRCDDNFLSLLKVAKGVILQNSEADIDSEKYALKIAKEKNIPIIVRADNAITLLSNDEDVILDPKRAFVYKNR